MQGDAYVARDSHWRLVILLFASIGFVVAGVWMAGLFGEPPAGRRWSPETVRIVGLASTALFGFFAFVIGKRLTNVGEAFRIDATGITHAQMVKQSFSWDEITQIFPVQISGQKMIAYDVVDERFAALSGLRGRLASANRSMTGCAFALAMSGTDAKFDEALAAVERFAPDRLLLPE
ncbi:STM3941 family protein [Aurantiacibacter gangjinensis]|uniref:Uncharacterized protein n=1 Tax=Aurantiacibacter gangjinensis TaxID=502682 RepID=A0A0G9MQ92_9SPHN|nr:STM3941 family protein [Aurantiacibacter gangjinensis]APE28533.1 hypothetical protein BMF35_a1704 [Aurantiacibacter gangjinensis]KLE32734.1 hypothetical protein AAW01_01400 [Aurantiacibacter gangjinensis]